MGARNRLAWLFAMTCLSCAAPARDGGVENPSSEALIDLDEHHRGFLAAMDSMIPEQLVDYFPRTGGLVYKHTVYAPDETRVEVRAFQAEEARAALAYERPLWASFQIQWESQPLGLFAYQALIREGDWHRVGPTRFVPPGADASSTIYLEWRLEGPKWVVSEFGDEDYIGGRLPDWCC